MSKRLTGPLASLLMLASVLTVVPLTASPAAAHDIYYWANQQQQQCAYDPFAGQQCWTVTVRVRVPSHHSHAQVCPIGTTGTYPDCHPILPTNIQVPDTPENDWTDPKDDDNGGGSGSSTGTGSGSGTDNGSGTDQGGGTDNGGGSGSGTEQGGGTDNGSGSNTSQTTDCGAYKVNLVDALSKIGNGVPGVTVPERPSSCPNLSTEELLAKIKDFTEAQALRLLKVLEALQDAPDKATQEATETVEALAREIKKRWDEQPPPVRAGITAVVSSAGCIGLAVLVAKSSAATGGGALAAWGAYFRSPAGKAAVERTCGVAVPTLIATVTYFVSGDNNNQNQNDGSSNDDTGSTPSTPAEWDKVVKEAEEKWRRNEIDGDELTRIQNERDCAYGHPWATNCP